LTDGRRKPLGQRNSTALHTQAPRENLRAITDRTCAGRQQVR